MRVLQSTKRTLHILDTNYVATSTDELCEKQTHLQPIEMDKLKKNIKKLSNTFWRETWYYDRYTRTIGNKKGEEPVNLKPFPIPVSRREVFKTEINRWKKKVY